MSYLFGPTAHLNRLQHPVTEGCQGKQRLGSCKPCQAHTNTWTGSHVQRRQCHVTRSVQQNKNQAANDADDGDSLLEKQLKGRGKTKGKKAQTKVADLSPPSAAQQASKMPPSAQFESSVVLILGGLFAAILGQGLFLALSGFLSESLDQFAQDVVYKTFSPTVGLFLACSAGYGLWKTKQEKK